MTQCAVPLGEMRRPAVAGHVPAMPARPPRVERPKPFTFLPFCPSALHVRPRPTLLHRLHHHLLLSPAPPGSLSSRHCGRTLYFRLHVRVLCAHPPEPARISGGGGPARARGAPDPAHASSIGPCSGHSASTGFQGDGRMPLFRFPPESRRRRNGSYGSRWDGRRQDRHNPGDTLFLPLVLTPFLLFHVAALALATNLDLRYGSVGRTGTCFLILPTCGQSRSCFDTARRRYAFIQRNAFFCFFSTEF